MKKKSIIFIVIAIILVIVGFTSTNTSNQTDAISKAVYVEDGKVLPENEGKIVIVPGKAEAIEPLVDTLTGVEIPNIRANRKVEMYERTTQTDEENNTRTVMEWKPTTQSGINQLDAMHSTMLVAKCKVGEFEIDEQIIKNISASTGLNNIDGKGPASKGYHVAMYKNVTYVSKIDYMPEGGEKVGVQNGWSTEYRHMNYENMPRISYTVPSGDSLEYTFIGKQQNGKIMYDKDLGMQAAFSGLQNPTELAERVESGGMIGAVVAWVIAAFLLFLGIISAKKTYVPTDEELRDIEKDIE